MKARFNEKTQRWERLYTVIGYGGPGFYRQWWAESVLTLFRDRAGVNVDGAVERLVVKVPGGEIIECVLRDAWRLPPEYGGRPPNPPAEGPSTLPRPAATSTPGSGSPTSR